MSVGTETPDTGRSLSPRPTTSRLHENDSYYASSNDMSKRLPVQELEMIDNTGEKGLYSGTVIQRTMKPHGQGSMIYSDCDVTYSGQWVHGDRSGFGTLTISGTVYQGGHFDNYKHGLGVLRYKDGRVFDGSFQLGKIVGKGNLTWADGSKFWGYFNADGEPHGRGKLQLTDGRVYDGDFDGGSIQGHGRMTWPDGSWYLGEWRDGKANGLGMQVASDGLLNSEGLYCNGESIKASSLPSTGKKSTGSFLLYRSSITGASLEGPLPENLAMRKQIFKC